MESTAIPGHGGWPSSTGNHAAPGQSATQKHQAYPIAQRGSSGPSFDSRPQAINYAMGNDNRRSFALPTPASYAYDDGTPLPWKQSGATEPAGSRIRRQSFSAPSMASSARNAPDYGNGSAESGSGVKPKDIWGGFSQGENGDCLTISGIKAAMMRFGQKPADVFKEVKEAGDGYDVTMRDGVKVHLSKDELEQATVNSKIKGDDPEMMKDANFMYAVSAKRAQMENNDGTAAQSFTQALETLKDGEDGDEGLMRLGLKDHIKQGSVSDLQNGAIGIVNRDVTNPEGETGGHSMVVVNGIEELWGTRNGLVTHGDVFLLT